MVRNMTEDEVRDKARELLGFTDSDEAQCGVGQLTTFNQLGFPGVSDKPDGWYLPNNPMDTALILETKATRIALGSKQVKELKKNMHIAQQRYKNVVGVLYNGKDIRVFRGDEEIEATDRIEKISYYLGLYQADSIDKERIYELPARINNSLHFDFGIKNLISSHDFHCLRPCCKTLGAFIMPGMDYSEFHSAILNCLNKKPIREKQQNRKLGLLSEIFAKIEMNLDTDSEEEKEQQRIKNLITCFIEWVTEISDCLSSDAWRGEDVMGIFLTSLTATKANLKQARCSLPNISLILCIVSSRLTRVTIFSMQLAAREVFLSKQCQI